jgi:SAM-dependent methyltransferase
MSPQHTTARAHSSPPGVGHGGSRWTSGHRSSTDSDLLGHTLEDHEEWLLPFFQRLAPGSEVLDLGCGCGIPDSRILAERFRVTGVDVSDVEIARARRLVPQARFLRADPTTVRFEPESFAGIVCLYSWGHVPEEEESALLERLYRWLEPGGLVLVTTGAESSAHGVPGASGSGVETYVNASDHASLARSLAAVGFAIVRRISVPEDDRDRALYLAQKSLDAPILRLGPRIRLT